MLFSLQHLLQDIPCAVSKQTLCVGTTGPQLSDLSEGYYQHSRLAHPLQENMVFTSGGSLSSFSGHPNKKINHHDEIVPLKFSHTCEWDCAEQYVKLIFILITIFLIRVGTWQCLPYAVRSFSVIKLQIVTCSCNSIRWRWSGAVWRSLFTIAVTGLWSVSI